MNSNSEVKKSNGLEFIHQQQPDNNRVVYSEIVLHYNKWKAAASGSGLGSNNLVSDKSKAKQKCIDQTFTSPPVCGATRSFTRWIGWGRSKTLPSSTPAASSAATVAPN